MDSYTLSYKGNASARTYTRTYATKEGAEAAAQRVRKANVIALIYINQKLIDASSIKVYPTPEPALNQPSA